MDAQKIYRFQLLQITGTELTGHASQFHFGGKKARTTYQARSTAGMVMMFIKKSSWRGSTIFVRLSSERQIGQIKRNLE